MAAASSDKKLPISTLDSLLLVNSIVQIGAGMAVMFTPKLVANPNTWTILKEGEWNGGSIVIGLRNLFGGASVSMGIMTLISFLRPHEKPTTPLLAGLSFYHIASLGPVLSNDDLNQFPMALAHGLLGLGFVNFALKDL